MKPCVASRAPPGHLFVESLAEIDSRKVAEVVRRTRDKKQRFCDPFFALSPKPIARFRYKRASLVFSGLIPTCQVSSKSIQVSEISENDVPDRYADKYHRCLAPPTTVLLLMT